MKLLENINSGKYNLIFHLYWKSSKIECFTVESETIKSWSEDQIKQLIYNTYKIDVAAIKNLSNVAIALQNGGITLPGSLTAKGNIITDGTLTAKGNITTDGTLTSRVILPDIMSATLTWSWPEIWNKIKTYFSKTDPVGTVLSIISHRLLIDKTQAWTINKF